VYHAQTEPLVKYYGDWGKSGEPGAPKYVKVAASARSKAFAMPSSRARLSRGIHIRCRSRSTADRHRTLESSSSAVKERYGREVEIQDVETRNPPCTSTIAN